MRYYRDLLEIYINDASLIHYVYASAANGLPLQSTINEKKFKLLFLDIGLVNRVSGLDMKIMFDSDLLLINRGAIAEQFVGQEMLAINNVDSNPPLYYWSRDKKGSDAEVDYTIQVGQDILPIEVKSGAVGRLKSLHLYQQILKPKAALKISQSPLGIQSTLISLPFYLIPELPRLIRSLASSAHEMRACFIHGRRFI